MDLNLVVLCGRLATPGELRQFESGTGMLRLLVSVRTESPTRRVDVVPVTFWDPDEYSHDVPMDASIVDGSHAATFRDLLGSLMDAPMDAPFPEGQRTTGREFEPAVILSVAGRRMEIVHIQVDFHVEEAETTFRVGPGDRIAELMLESVGGSDGRVIWNNDLQRYTVNTSGLVVDRFDGRDRGARHG